LLTVNDLFNKYAMPCDMYENCLLLLHICRHDDVVHIQKFWKGLFCEEIFPSSTRSEQAYRSLRSFVEGSLMDNPVVTLLDETTSAEDTLFESGSWMKKLEGRVVSLGKEVFGTGADYIFPVDFITSCLEGKIVVDGYRNSCHRALVGSNILFLHCRVASCLCFFRARRCCPREPRMAFLSSCISRCSTPGCLECLRTNY
jgi:hypothetical protein